MDQPSQPPQPAIEDLRALVTEAGCEVLETPGGWWAYENADPKIFIGPFATELEALLVASDQPASLEGEA